MTFDAEEQVLQRMGVDFHLLDSGCCGMAGSFGFERDHYDVSMKVGERVLLPAVRSAPRDTLILADGFSCRTQIAEARPRRALHLADAIEMAVQSGVNGPAGDDPERWYVPEYGVPRSLRAWAGIAALAVGLGAAAYGASRRLRSTRLSGSVDAAI
jgi:hypothetical protein